MSKKSSQKKAEQLGMPIGTASGKLKKAIMFALIKEANLDICFQCGEKIENINNLSIEHMIPWFDSEDPIGLYFDLNNIAFSHTSCNYGASRGKPPYAKLPEHGTRPRYNRGCRCDKCTEANRIYSREWDNKKGRTHHN